MTQKALSELCQIPQPNLSNIEKDLADVTVSTLKRLAKALSVRPSELIDDDPAESSDLRVLTREKIERLAAAIYGKKTVVSDEEAEVVLLFQKLLPQKTSAYVSLSALNDAWLRLRELLDKKDIESIYKRVHDAEARDA